MKPRDAFPILEKALGESEERFRVFEELTKAQQKIVRDTVASVDGEFAFGTLHSLGLPQRLYYLRRWCGLDPPTILERKAGKWPAWKWIKAAQREEVTEAKAIAALTKALSKDDVFALCARAVEHQFDSFKDYDFFGHEERTYEGDAACFEVMSATMRFLAALVAATDAERFAEIAMKVDGPKPIATVAALALARSTTTFPDRFLGLAEKIGSPTSDVPVGPLMREVVETVAPSARDAFIEAFAPLFVTGSAIVVKNHKEREVPALASGWLYADLCASPRVVKGVAADVARWDQVVMKRPTKDAITILEKANSPLFAPTIAALKKRKK